MGGSSDGRFGRALGASLGGGGRNERGEKGDAGDGETHFGFSVGPDGSGPVPEMMGADGPSIEPRARETFFHAEQ